MNGETQSRLLEIQKDINHKLRYYHNKEDGEWNNTITAVIAALSDGAPFLLFFGGILTSLKSNNLMRGDGNVGVVVSLQWIFNQYIRQKLDRLWQDNWRNWQPDLNLGYSYAEINMKRLRALENLRFTFPSRPGKVNTARKGHLNMSFERVCDGDEYLVKVSRDGACRYEMMLRSLSSPHSVVC